MKNKKIFRTLAALCTCLMLMGGFSVTAFVVTVMSCLLPPKSSTRAALPSGVRAGLSPVSSTTTFSSLVASAAGG